MATHKKVKMYRIHQKKVCWS